MSDEDFEFLMQWKWTLSNRGYAKRFDVNSTPRTVFIHIEVAKRSGVYIPGRFVDHKDLDQLNNTRQNLRPATPQQNQANIGPQKNNKHGYKGVGFSNSVSEKPWRARIRVNNRLIHLGYFQTAEEAQAAYSRAASEHFGEYARS